MKKGEAYDYAVAFCKGVKTGQDEGKINRKILTLNKVEELLGVDLTAHQMSHQMLDVFKEYNVYIRKLRGISKFAVWWFQETIHHGRGIKK